MTEPRDALREALTTALTVALHETFDPECSGEPPYDSSQRLAAEVMAMPVVRAALAASPTPDHSPWRDMTPEQWDKAASPTPDAGNNPTARRNVTDYPTPDAALNGAMVSVVEQAARMGSCSQTHHDWIADAARKALAARGQQ